MTTPSTQISASDVNTENGYASNQQMSFDDAVVRTLAGAGGSGTAISMAMLLGKSRIFNISAGAPKQNLNIYNDSIAAGWPGTSALKYTIPAGIYIWSDSTALPALTTGGAFPGGLTIVNNGFIMGKGGQGGPGITGGGNGTYHPGSPGGTAISLGVPVTIDNTYPTAYIGGGGGGGGGGTSIVNSPGGGGGAGGGAGGQRTQLRNLVNTAAAGGAIGQVGANGVGGPNGGGGGSPDIIYGWAGAGGGGGRLFPGTGGAGGPNQGGGGAGGGAGGGGGGLAWADGKLVYIIIITPAVQVVQEMLQAELVIKEVAEEVAGAQQVA